MMFKKIAEFLRIEIIQNKWLALDLWSILHLFYGCIVVYFISLYKLKRLWIYTYTLTILILWEIFEFVLYNRQIPIIYPETILDVLWDIIIGMIGAVLIYEMFLNKNSKKKKYINKISL